jgi:hypothetical protein
VTLNGVAINSVSQSAGDTVDMSRAINLGVSNMILSDTKQVNTGSQFVDQSISAYNNKLTNIFPKTGEPSDGVTTSADNPEWPCSFGEGGWL